MQCFPPCHSYARPPSGTQISHSDPSWISSFSCLVWRNHYVKACPAQSPCRLSNANKMQLQRKQLSTRTLKEKGYGAFWKQESFSDKTTVHVTFMVHSCTPGAFHRVSRVKIQLPAVPLRLTAISRHSHVESELEPPWPDSCCYSNRLTTLKSQ